MSDPLAPAVSGILSSVESIDERPSIVNNLNKEAVSITIVLLALNFTGTKTLLCVA